MTKNTNGNGGPADAEEEWLRSYRAGAAEHQRLEDEAFPIVRALRDGDLETLADYLSAGGLRESPLGTIAVPEWVAHEIVDMIRGEPWAFFRLITEGRKKGEQGWTKALEIDDRRWRVGYFAERRIRETGRRKEAIWEVGEHFEIGKTKVEEDLSFVREYLKRTEPYSWDGWCVLTSAYAADYPWTHPADKA